MNEEQNNNQVQSPAREKRKIRAYVPNKGMPSFVGTTEITRLRKVVDEKNALIDNFKKYDEERRAYYKGIQDLVDRLESENSELKTENTQLQKDVEKLRKKQEPLFAPELRKLMESGDINATAYEKFMALYSFWLSHRNKVKKYQSRMTAGSGSIKHLMSDLQSIQDILMTAGKMDLLDRLSPRMYSMTSHLDALQQQLYIGVNDLEQL